MVYCGDGDLEKRRKQREVKIIRIFSKERRERRGGGEREKKNVAGMFLGKEKSKVSACSSVSNFLLWLIRKREMRIKEEVWDDRKLGKSGEV